MTRQVLTGTTNQTDPANVFCVFDGVTYNATIFNGTWQIVIPRKVMDKKPELARFTVTIKNSAGNKIYLRRNARLKQPDIPGNFETTQLSANSVRLTWNMPESRDRIVGYQVLHNGRQIQLSKSTSMDVVNVPVGVKQTFQIRSKDNLGFYSIPVTITKTIKKTQAPRVKITSQKTGAITNNTYTLTWANVEPAQWETWVKVWDINKKLPISNVKYPRGVTSAPVAGYGSKVYIEVTNIPENAAGTGPNYANPTYWGVQTILLAVTE